MRSLLERQLCPDVHGHRPPLEILSHSREGLDPLHPLCDLGVLVKHGGDDEATEIKLVIDGKVAVGDSVAAEELVVTQDLVEGCQPRRQDILLVKDRDYIQMMKPILLTCQYLEIF